MTQQQVTLDQLPELYRSARAAADERALWDEGDAPPRTCRYCGKFRQTWHGTAIPGHARCVVTVEFMRAVLQVYRSDPRQSRKSIGEALGVSHSVVATWTRVADQANGQRRRSA